MAKWWLSQIKTMLSLISKYYFVFGIMSASIIGYQYWSNIKLTSRIEDLSENNTKLTMAFDLEKSTVEELQIELYKANAVNDKLIKNIRNINKGYTEMTNKINKHRGRLYDATIKKPHTIKRLINRRTSELMREFEEVTSGPYSSNKAPPLQSSGSDQIDQH